MRSVWMLGFSIWVFTCRSQNLVPNSGFEIKDECPKQYTIGSKKWLIPSWYMPTKGTADYFNACTQIQVGVPQNFMGNCFAKDGQAYVGLILLEDPPKDTLPQKSYFNYREYLQTELIKPLEKDRRYLVRFHYSIASYSTYAINRLGFYFSKDQIKKRGASKILYAKPQIAMDSTTINTERDNWVAVSDTFRAKGGERFLTIGNFYDDRHTKYVALDLSKLGSYLEKRIATSRIAYYYMDMLLVEKLD